jgi:hypothetical protein
MRAAFATALEVAGVGLIVAGCWLILPASALIVAGLVVVAAVEGRS